MMFTDGQFNSMCPNLDDKTMMQRREAHLQSVAPGATMWRSVFWNLNGSVPGFQAREDTPNMQLVSGYSQSLFRQVLVGDYEIVVDQSGKAHVHVDPWQTFMKAVEDVKLLPILQVLSASQEGVLQHYHLPVDA